MKQEFVPVEEGGDGRVTFSVDDDAVVAKVNEELADYETPFNASCSCGWLGNNPYPHRDGAVSSLTAHYKAVGVSE